MSWMAWTPVTAVFFTVIVMMLIGMTIAEIKMPTAERKGFLPLVTTRGDRLFIGLLSSAYVCLAWVALLSAPLWIATLLCLAWIAVLFKWG